MRARRSCLVLAALLVVPARAGGERHNWEVSASGSRVRGSSLWGGSASISLVFESVDLGIIAEAAQNAGSHRVANLSQFSGLLGVRWWRPLPIGNSDQPKWLPFLVAYGGGVRSDDSPLNLDALDGTGLAWGIGGGLDALFSDYGGLRFQVDNVWFNADAGRESFLRFSAGLVYRFHDPCECKTPPSPSPQPPPAPAPPSP